MPDLETSWARLVRAAQTKQSLSACLARLTDRGAIAIPDGFGIEGFVPARHRRTGSVPGQRVAVIVVEADPVAGRLVLRETGALGTARADLTPKRSEGGVDHRRRSPAFTPGDHVSGRVTEVSAVGVRVDLGGVEGVVPASELAWERTAPRDLAHVGDRVGAMVLDLDVEAGRVTLSMKALQPSPWPGLPDRLAVDDVVFASVVRRTQLGFFVRLVPGVTELVRWESVTDLLGFDPSGPLESLDAIWVRITSVDPARERVGVCIVDVAPRSGRRVVGPDGVNPMPLDHLFAWTAAGVPLGDVAPWVDDGWEPREAGAWWTGAIRDPVLARRWQRVGGDPALAAAWSGWAPEAAGPWIAHGFRCRKATQWSAHFPPEVASAWLTSNASLDQACRWTEIGVGPPEAAPWLDYAIGPDDSVRWRTAGASPGTAASWSAALGPGAVAWFDLGLPLPDARSWSVAGIAAAEVSLWWHRSPAEAGGWASAGFSASDADRWCDAGWSAETAAPWWRASFTPEEAGGWREVVGEAARAARWRLHFSLGQAREWVDTSLSPTAAAAWSAQSIGPGSATAWTEMGLTPASAARWERQGISSAAAGPWLAIDASAAIAAQWLAAGWDAVDASAWFVVGITPAEAREWVSAGVEPADALAWKRARCLPPRAAAWRAARIRPEAAPDWERFGVEPDVASAWHRCGFAASAAEPWRARGWTPGRARRWANATWTASAATPWQASGWTDAEEARRWHGHGWSPAKACRARALGLLPAQTIPRHLPPGFDPWTTKGTRAVDRLFASPRNPGALERWARPLGRGDIPEMSGREAADVLRRAGSPRRRLRSSDVPSVMAELCARASDRGWPPAVAATIAAAQPVLVDAPEAHAKVDAEPPPDDLLPEVRLPFPLMLVLFSARFVIDPCDLAALPEWAMPSPRVGLPFEPWLAHVRATGCSLAGVMLQSGPHEAGVRDGCIWVLEVDGAFVPVPGSRSKGAPVLDDIAQNLAAALCFGSWSAGLHPTKDPRGVGPSAAPSVAEPMPVHEVRYRSRGADEAAQPGQTGSTRRAHVRRGHWRRVHVGPRQEASREWRWIAPTHVGGTTIRDTPSTIYRLPRLLFR